MAGLPTVRLRLLRTRPYAPRRDLDLGALPRLCRDSRSRRSGSQDHGSPLPLLRTGNRAGPVSRMDFLIERRLSDARPLRPHALDVLLRACSYVCLVLRKRIRRRRLGRRRGRRRRRRGWRGLAIGRAVACLACCPANQRTVDRSHVRATGKHHRFAELVLEQFEHSLHPFGSIYREPPENRAADHHRLGS